MSRGNQLLLLPLRRGQSELLRRLAHSLNNLIAECAKKSDEFRVFRRFAGARNLLRTMNTAHAQCERIDAAYL